MAVTTNSEIPIPVKAGRTFKKVVEVDCFPVIASPKFDGYRCITQQATVSLKTGLPAVAWSRSQKPIPSLYVQKILAEVPAFLDGELTCGENFQECGAITRKSDAEIPFTFWVFDYFSPGVQNLPWAERVGVAAQIVKALPPEIQEHVKICPFAEAHNSEDLEEIWAEFYAFSTEGLMLRTPSPEGYNCGGKSKNLIKFKPLEQMEAIILGFEQEVYGHGLKTVPEHLWGTKKDRHCAILAKGLPGTIFEGKTLRIGTGINHDKRKEFFDKEEEFLGQYVTFRFLLCGTKELPRQPAYVGIRPQWDMN